jgi:gluconolactonase
MPFTILDDRFQSLVDADEQLVELNSDGAFTEGPVWFGDLQCLLWSDIPNNRILRWTPDGQVSVFRSNSRNSNGNTRDRQGRLVTAEHSGRRVTRTEVDGTITVIADRFEGKKLNSPNDVVVKSDGSVWFTDPQYGLWASFPGFESEQAYENVYRVDPSTGEVRAVVSDFDKPNGLAFSPDEQWLYVADSAVSHTPGANSHLRRFRVSTSGTLSGGEVFAVTDGIPDGLRVDANGNVWTSAGPKIDVYSSDAVLLGQVTGFAADVTNLCFGSASGNQLFVTAGSSLYTIKVLASGDRRP